ncbi:DUF4376 domain-containing protein [Kingella bonacorsii]|uniref:DUF4376 domain-containing protein n=1 Tax=Kingella bonacorsii TaxID=2796361 RepID=A0ABS1BWV6_9NEIS|nr:DUF4376 domain-containing protein [Kingella bonacorsii]MBK0397270.1 DUF4376 domain-containing protein [Kingella bonacorsii]
MQNHYFDTTDPLHPYLYSTAANPDSMPPDNALRIGPIHRDGFWPCETDGQWQYLPDYRGKTAYRTDNGQPETVQTVGELPAHLTLTAPPSELHQWNGKTWTLSKEAAAAVKAEQQAEMWERIKAKRAQSCHAGIYIKSLEKWLHSDADSRQQYTFLRTLNKLPEDLVWKTLDNSFVPMTRELLDELSLKLIADEQHDFQNAERHKAAMLKAENPLEYDYSSGWSAAELMDKEVQHG